MTANRYGFHDADAYATGYLIVSKCLTLHDESREANLETYTTTALRNEYARLRRKAHNNQEFTCDPVELDKIEGMPESTSSTFEITTQIVRSLPKKYRRIVIRHWIDGVSLRKIASANKVSVSKIRKLLNEAMTLMRKAHERIERDLSEHS